MVREAVGGRAGGQMLREVGDRQGRKCPSLCCHSLHTHV